MATTRQLLATRQLLEAMNPAELVRRIEELEQRVMRLEESQRPPAKKATPQAKK